MRNLFLFITVLLFQHEVVLGAEGEYAVSRIPAELLKNANAVKRAEKIIFEVKSPGEAILYRKYAITILNEKGDEYAGFVEYYDKLHEIRNIEGTLYDANGKELKRLKNKQVLDLSGTDDNNLADDSRMKAHHFYHKVYPYTVVYEVEIKYHGTLFFPKWIPREHEFYAVQGSSITLTLPANYTARYKAFNYEGEPFEATGKNSKSLTWEIKELPAIQNEYAAPAWYKRNTAVFFGPTDFEIEGHKGSMRSWEEFGKFIYELNKGRDKLPDAVKQAVHRLTDGESDPKIKIAKLYQYMQQNTRYISIQLGIGGWQPFDAAFVATKSYGDCKALSNYMYSLLKEAGIGSNYTLIRAGRNAKELITDFPSSQFNHAILFVPLGKDTVWLECTSQTLPAGYLGDFTSNRDALAITEKGGVIVSTPRYGVGDNTQIRKITGMLDEESTLHTKARTRYHALQQDYYHSMINGLSKEKVKEWLHKRLDLATYDITSFDFVENKSAMPFIDESLDLVVSNYATITGKRLFIVPNILTRSSMRLAPDVERKHDLEMGWAYTDIDTVEILLPGGYKVESMPKPVSLRTPFGEYESSIRVVENKLFYFRSYKYFGGRFPSSAYRDLAAFYDAVYRSDRGKIVFVKDTRE